MPSSKAVLGSALTATLLLGGAPAEARFGKRSTPSSSGGTTRPERGADRPDASHERRSREHPATPVGQGSNDGRPAREHPATAIGKERDAQDDAPRRRRRRARVPVSAAVVGVGAAGASASPRLNATTRTERRRDEPVPLLVRMGAQADWLTGGGAMGLFMAMEGRRMGLDTRITGLTLRAEDGSDKVDRITLLSARVTAALWASARGRVRVEAGLTSAHAPSVIFVGPSFGASVEACIGASPLDVEARVNATPFPHRQVDAQAGMALHLGGFNLRGGWRALYLNDAGHVDGVEHEEGFGGPYFGLGLTF
ncbi:hypothetical protein FJV41_00790 [Myxococcus llanfairpwllgwyngyllgogerychwyrndrobwllllantysiliogogogochensis]|uniref:Uncharacterized protein n=1 Tax=Myxococcus llanfairpwllgwyngyllgogerychwyrndrobwllllantysiliogogogochensis TaxID=2590453 RepID=A0A540XB55_9BACT|nr:hypothetical protein [Myxococcus llanfairpwllgwyngyllgogerychwyrndrobwllllantysiliogogogochensis]TQF17914.1 hypothetical protein FJV41_00790 [Myxococcus llanfairpwllgwyngyllgogerychwyrndrobwllllantysiliogogogochensis]